MEDLFCRKVLITEVPSVYELYLREEKKEPNRLRLQALEAKAKEIYRRMLISGSYTYGCFYSRGPELQFTQLVGVININKILDYYPDYDEHPYVHLETFIVDKRFQNKGIGTYLMTSAIEQVKKEGCTYIICQSDNEYVQRIAKKAGLTESIKDMRYDFVKD